METLSHSIFDVYQDRSRKIIIENIKKYIEAYDPEWIAIHEALQNAIDAIQRSEQPNGNVMVEIWLDTEHVKITDNGRGFPPNLDLLCPGITDKNESGVTKGYQGVGLKALMHSTKTFKISSNYESKKRWEIEATDLYKLLEDEDTDISIKEAKIDLQEPCTGGTEISYSFPQSIVSEFFSELFDKFYSDEHSNWRTIYSYIEDDNERTKEEIGHVLRWYFQSFTYAADCNRLLDVKVKPYRMQSQTTYVKPIEIEIVIHRAEDLSKFHTCLSEYFLSSDADSFNIIVANKQWDFEEQINYLKDQPRRFSSQAPEIEKFTLVTDDWIDRYQSLKDRIYIRKLLPNGSSSDFDVRYAEFISLLTTRGSKNIDWEHRYGSLFERILGIYLVIGRTTLFERFGTINRGERFIAANGIPTSHEITIRSTSSTWYLETIHFIVNVDERLNYGKKQIANTRLIGKVRDYFDEAYSKLMQLSKAFVRQEDSRRDDGNEITTDFISLPDLSLSHINLIKQPADENSLVFLFAQLLNYEPLLRVLETRSVDIQIYGLLAKGIYDGKFRWSPEHQPLADDHLKSLEFKISLNNLLIEFESAKSSKQFTETDLIIVWRDDLVQDDPIWKIRGVDDQRRRELSRKGVPSYIHYVLEDDRTAQNCPIIVVEYWIEEILAKSTSK